MPQFSSSLNAALLLLGLAVAIPASAATWSVEGSVSDERTTDVESKAEGEGTESTSTETVEQSYTISYETDLATSFILDLEFGLDVTNEINEGPRPDTDYDTREIEPSLEATLTAEWWDLNASWEKTQKTSNDPGQPRTDDATWDVEFNADTGGQTLPSAKVKFQRDREQEGGVTQKVDDSLEASLDYTFWELLDLTFDAKKETVDDRVTGDSDTEDRDFKLDLSLDREFGETVKFEAKWTNERKQSVQLTDDGYLIPPREDTLDNSLQAKLSYKPLEAIELSVEKQTDWESDLEQDTLGVEDTWTGDASFTASLTDALDLDLGYTDERTDTRGTDNDEYIISQDYSIAIDFSPLENITFSPSFDRTAERKWPDQDVPERTTDDKLELALDTSFWEDQIEFSGTRTFQRKTKNHKADTEERNWDVDLTVKLEGLPDLELNPQFTYTHDKDLLTDKTDVERKFEFGILYEVNLGDVLVITLDHTYSRTSTEPSEGASSIKREDNTDAAISWKEFLRGMSLELDCTRKASDESEDDKGPEIDYTYSATYEWVILERYAISFEYELDKKSESEDTRNFLTTVSMEFLDGLLQVDFEHEFEEQLEGDTKDTHRYLIEIQGKF